MTVAGIKVEVKQGKRWWYVVADFGDGRPVTKGPMREDEAKAMAAELRAVGEEEGAKVIDGPSDSELNRRFAIVAIAGISSAVLFVIALVLWTVLR